jgi:tetratricopeptide (TPR) repeat protein
LYALVALEIVVLSEPQAPEAPSARAPQTPGRAALREVRRSVESSEQRVRESDDALRSELAALAQRVLDADPWKALGVPASASDESIRAAYADLAKRTHPDRFIGANDATRLLADKLFGCVSNAFDAIRDAETRAARARELKEAERNVEARKESERAVFAEREFTRGEGLLRARRVSDALQAFRNAVEAYPKECDYHVYFGWAHYLASPETPGRVDQAIRMVMKGRKLAPDRRTAYLFLGRLSQAAGRIDHAEKMFARTIQLDPNCVEAMRELRLVRMRQDKAKGIVGRMLGR